jgi:hypothetical protein
MNSAEYDRCASLRTLVAPVDLLLKDNTVDACLEQSECQTCLTFQFAQTVENFGTGIRSEVVDGSSQLSMFGSVFRFGDA